MALLFPRPFFDFLFRFFFSSSHLLIGIFNFFFFCFFHINLIFFLAQINTIPRHLSLPSPSSFSTSLAGTYYNPSIIIVIIMIFKFYYIIR